MKLLRTIRLDPSDSFVFASAAQPGEWAVPGGFEFWDGDPAALSGQRRQAFRAGFLGLSSFGWSTLVVAVEASADERAGAVESLAAHLVRAHGAPDLEAARAAAEEEVAYAGQLASHPEGTLIALHRTVADDGSIAEQFRTLRPADSACTAWTFESVEDIAPASEADAVDLVALARPPGAPAP